MSSLALRRYLACLLAGIPTVSLTSGGTEASATQETARSLLVQRLLMPCLLIGEECGLDCPRLGVEDVLASISCKTTAEDCLREYAFGDRDTVAYHFTGGRYTPRYYSHVAVFDSSLNLRRATSFRYDCIE